MRLNGHGEMWVAWQLRTTALKNLWWNEKIMDVKGSTMATKRLYF